MVTLRTRVYGKIDIPDGLRDLDSFLRWRQSEGVPEKLKAHFYRGEVGVDLMEEYLSHNQVKSVLGAVLGHLIRTEDLGSYVPDGMMLRNDAADLATEPDAMFVSHESFVTKRVKFTAGRKRGAVATVMVGIPDLVIEVISPSSEDSDAAWLMSAYHNANIPEYWLIDARPKVVSFDIFRHKPKGFAPTRKIEGWIKSAALGHSFRLSNTIGKSGLPNYDLEVR